MNKKKLIPILIVLTLIFTIFGATFAYWSWSSDNANKTNITFTIGADFSCGANGGGNIASSNIAPASCTNSTYAIRREITTTITNSGSDPVFMDMWLTVNSIDQALSDTSNFKWALTTDSTTCSNNVINRGTFQGKTANSTITILSGSTASTATYYLYVWLDNAETSTATMNKSFNLSLGGTCANGQPEYIYTLNLYDKNIDGYNYIWQGQQLPNTDTINVYHDPNGAENAMTALKAATGGTIDTPYYQMHRLADDGTVIESYIGFVITPSMVTAATSSYTTKCNSSYTQMGYSDATECINAYTGATAGTYTLRGHDLCRPENKNSETGKCGVSAYYEANKATLLSAFGASNCIEYAPSPTCQCTLSGVIAVTAIYAGDVIANTGASPRNSISSDGYASCVVK